MKAITRNFLIITAITTAGVLVWKPWASRPAGNITDSAESGVAQRSSLRWGGPKNISMLPLIAENQGLFQKEGLAATFVDIQTGKKAVDALRTGDIQLAVGVDTNVSFAGFEEADDLRVVACIMKKSDDSLVVSKDLAQPASLAGQTIGVTLGTSSHAYVVQFLEANGMKPGDVKLQNMPPPAIQAGLLNGSLKAGALWQPFRYNVLTAKAGSLIDLNDRKVYTSYVLLLSTKKFAEAESAKGGNSVISQFLRALIVAEGYAAKNAGESQKIISEKISIPADVMAKIWPEYSLKVDLDDGLLSLLQKEGKWISESVEEQRGKPVPNYRPYVQDSFLRAVDASRIRGLK